MLRRVEESSRDELIQLDAKRFLDHRLRDADPEWLEDWEGDRLRGEVQSVAEWVPICRREEGGFQAEVLYLPSKQGVLYVGGRRRFSGRETQWVMGPVSCGSGGHGTRGLRRVGAHPRKN